MNHKAKKLNRENNKMDQYLSGEYESVMTDMVCYLRGADITDEQIELIRRDLLEMFIEAYNRKESVQSLIGEDYRTFCDHIIETVPKKTKRQKYISMISTIMMCVGTIGLIKSFISEYFIHLIRTLSMGNHPNWFMPISWGDLISMLLIIIVASWSIEYICKHAFQLSEDEIHEKKHSTFVFISVFVTLSLLMLIQYCLKGFVLFYVPFYLVILMFVLILVISRLLDELQ